MSSSKRKQNIQAKYYFKEWDNLIQCFRFKQDVCVISLNWLQMQIIHLAWHAQKEKCQMMKPADSRSQTVKEVLLS